MSTANNNNNELEAKLQSMQDFITLIQNKQIENALRLSKQTTITVGGKTYKKKSLSAKQWREISVLNSQMETASSDIGRLDKLIELRQKGAFYYFGIPAEVFDEHFEKLNPIVEGCILRSNTGLSPDVDLDKLLVEYQKATSKK